MVEHYTLEGLPVAQERVCAQIDSEIFSELRGKPKSALREFLVDKLTKIQKENPKLIFYHMSGRRVADIQNPKEINEAKLEYLSGFVATYEILRVQARKYGVDKGLESLERSNTEE